MRKFDYCYEKLDLRPGDHILEVGPGWGAWFEYASRRGVTCTGGPAGADAARAGLRAMQVKKEDAADFHATFKAA